MSDIVAILENRRKIALQLFPDDCPTPEAESLLHQECDGSLGCNCPPHGKKSTYDHHKCRGPLCREATRVYGKRYVTNKRNGESS